MKVRIQGNSIRLRLKQFEVAAFAETKLVSEELKFSNSPGGILSFILKVTDDNKTQVVYNPGEISISIPLIEMEKWTRTEQVGIESKVMIEKNLFINVLIEKDFKCLDRKDEDEVGSYPNPLEAC